MDKLRWRQLEELFDSALSLEPAAREKFLAELARSDPATQIELAALLQAHDAAGEFLSGEAQGPRGVDAPETGSLAPDTRLGAWRIVRFLSHGGMGEVYEAARADGQFEQRAALKLTRREATKLLERFSAERQMLARLDHPGIARLLDGGVADDGRPFAVMEFVEGRTIVEWCAYRKLTLRERLVLFLQVCDAVAHAHGHLIVHRDLKPSNVLVDSEGRVRLLDFGIAKPLDAVWPGGAAATETAALMTPDYASPEQLAGEPITTATDVYGLGMLLFEMLTGRRPWQHDGRPIAKVLHDLLDTPAPRGSDIVEANGDAPIQSRDLRGDLDAIVAKCLRRESSARYPTVVEVKRDISAALDGAPVAASGDARSYLVGKFVRRHRWLVAAGVLLVAVLSAGIVATTWQARRAEREARRAEQTRDFLVSVFEASDPRLTRNRPPGSITAKELLDASVDRIDKELADDPETRLALLEAASEIYGYWAEEEPFMALLKKRTELARTHFGPTHPTVVESVIVDAWGSIYTQNYKEASRLLAEADDLIRKGGHEGTRLQAGWYVAQAEAYRASDPQKRLEAIDKAVALYERKAPDDPMYPAAVANGGSANAALGNFVEAKRRNERAIALYAAGNGQLNELSVIFGNQAAVLTELGEFAASEKTYGKFEETTRTLFGHERPTYWVYAAERAQLAHQRGERARAHQMFEALWKHIPADHAITTLDIAARATYGEVLAAEGRPAEALPLLEKAETTWQERPGRESDLRRARMHLGDAYDRLGRADDARRMLSASLEESLKKDRKDSVMQLTTRERWARFLATHGQLDDAEREARSILAASAGKPLAPAVRAQDDLAMIALARRDAKAALAASEAARMAFEKVSGNYDVRLGPVLERTYASALEISGDLKGAAAARTRALEASRVYDDPSSPTTR